MTHSTLNKFLLINSKDVNEKNHLQLRSKESFNTWVQSKWVGGLIQHLCLCLIATDTSYAYPASYI